MKPVSHFLRLAIVSLFAFSPAHADSPPAMNVRFDPGAIYLRTSRGTQEGVVNDYLGPQATTGVLCDAMDKKIGEVVNVHATEFDSILKVSRMENGKQLSDASYLALNGVEKGAFLIFTEEDSSAYFRIDKGTDQIDSKTLKRSAKGQLLDANGKMAGLCQIVTTSANESLGYLTQYQHGFFARDIVTCKITGYFTQIVQASGLNVLTFPNVIMILIAIGLIYLAIKKDYEPLLLLPIGFGVLMGNIPLPLSVFNNISVYMIDPVTHEYTFNTSEDSVLGIIYFAVRNGIIPPLIFLGIGAMTDFSALLSNPKGLFLGAAAQLGISATFIGALFLGFTPQSAAAIGIIGGADGPTAIFTAGRLAPSLIGPIAIAAYSYMAMVPLIQPPIMRLLTTEEERKIRMKPGRKVSKFERIAFPIGAFLVTCLVAPGGLVLLGPLFFGNLLKESGVTGRLAKTASNAMLDICTILLGMTVGASTSATVFLTKQSVLIFVLGCLAFAIATAGGVLFAKLMNLFSKEKVNPLIGAAGVSAVPNAARVAHVVGQKADPTNYLLQHAMGPNVAGVIGSAIAAGFFLGLF